MNPPPTKWEKTRNILTYIIGIPCLVIGTVLVIMMLAGGIKTHYNRAQIKKEPVRSEATITGFGDKRRAGGRKVYYEYVDNGVVYQGWDRPGDKTVETLKVGQIIPIDYQKSDPSNSMMLHDKLFE